VGTDFLIKKWLKYRLCAELNAAGIVL